MVYCYIFVLYVFYLLLFILYIFILLIVIVVPNLHPQLHRRYVLIGTNVSVRRVEYWLWVQAPPGALECALYN